MKTVYETSDYPEMLIKKGLLEDSGIPVYVENFHGAGGAMPELGFTLGYRVMVPDSSVGEALAIVHDVEPESTLTGHAMVPEAGKVSTSFSKSLMRVFVAVLMIYFAFNVVGDAFAAGATICTQDKWAVFDCYGFPLGWRLGLESWPL